MRFLLYNVRYCAGTGRRFHLPFPGSGYLRKTTGNLGRITEFIQSLAPDIAGLVEVDSGSFRSRRQNQAEVIARAIGCYHSYQSKYADESFMQILPLANKQVNAFLSNDRIQNEKFHYFDRGVKRLVIELELENLTLFLVHLSLKFRHRYDQLRELCKLVNRVQKPHIVAGDFNALWGEGEVHWFLAATGLVSANASDLPTYPSWAPKRQLDFILHSREIKVTRFHMPRVKLSDHLPLVCDFEIEGVRGRGAGRTPPSEERAAKPRSAARPR